MKNKTIRPVHFWFIGASIASYKPGISARFLIILLFIFLLAGRSPQVGAATVGFEFGGTIDNVVGPSTYSDFGIEGSLGDTFSLSLFHTADAPLVYFGEVGGAVDIYRYTPTTFTVMPVVEIEIGGYQLTLDESFFVRNDGAIYTVGEQLEPQVRIADNYSGPSAGLSILDNIPAGDAWYYQSILRQVGTSDPYTTSFVQVWLVFDDQTIGDGELLDYESSLGNLIYAGFNISRFETNGAAFTEVDGIAGTADLNSFQAVALPGAAWLFITGIAGLAGWRNISRRKVR